MWIIKFGKKTIKENTKEGAEMFIRILKANGIEYTVSESERR